MWCCLLSYGTSQRDSGRRSRADLPEAINIPGDDLEAILSAVPDKSTPLFTYCLRDSRSSKAAGALKGMGYANVINMGGINKYKGETEA